MTNTLSPLRGWLLVPLLSGLALLSVVVTGCAHTANGVSQDAATDTQKVGQAAHNADAHAAVTPEVKTSIVRDPVLNNPANLINVDSRDYVTHLTGHVLTTSMKQRATEDA